MQETEYINVYGARVHNLKDTHPRYLINRRRITRLLKRQRKEETT